MRIATLIFLLLATLLPSYSVVGELHELEFKDKQTYYLYNDAKATLRFTGLSADTALIQAQISQANEGPKARIIGSRSKSPEAGIVDFTVEIIPDVSGRPLKSSIQLKLKTFKKAPDNAYEIIDSFTNYIRTKECPKQGPPVCSVVKVNCREGSIDCYDGLKEIYQNFETACDSNKAGATIHSYGLCQ